MITKETLFEDILFLYKNRNQKR